MKLACNYYAETEELVTDGKIDIDYFKFPAIAFQMNCLESGSSAQFESFCKRVTPIKPILLHGLYPNPIDLSSPGMQEDIDPETTKYMVELSGTPGISMHPSLFGIESSVSGREIIKTVVKNLLFVKQAFPTAEFISIENLDTEKFGALLDPEVIYEIVREADCGFLLDICHAIYASRLRGDDPRQYIKRLPLHKVTEIHMSGWMARDDRKMSHTKITPMGYELLGETLSLCSPKIITVEYGRDNDRLGAGIPLLSPDRINEDAKSEIIEQVDKIREIIDAF